MILVIAGAAGVYYLSQAMSNGTSSTLEFKSPSVFPDNIDELIANFSQMKIAVNMTGHASSANGSGSLSQNSVSSYNVVGSIQNGSGKLTIVNFTSTESGSGSPYHDQFLVYFDQTWNATLVIAQGHNYTGSSANSFALDAEYNFGFVFEFEKQFLENSSDFSKLTMQGTASAETFGNIQLSTTTYVERGLTSSSYFEVRLGSLEGKSFSIPTYIKGSDNISIGGLQETQSYQYQLISATLAS